MAVGITSTNEPWRVVIIVTLCDKVYDLQKVNDFLQYSGLHQSQPTIMIWLKYCWKWC